MALTVPNLGEQLMLDAATGKTAATVWTLRLYTNNVVLSGASVAANFVEATGGSYAGIALTAVNWVTTPGAPTVTSYPKVTFTFSGALTTNPNILGYYVTNVAGAVIFAEALAGPFAPANTGDTLDVTLNVTLGSIVGD